MSDASRLRSRCELLQTFANPADAIAAIDTTWVLVFCNDAQQGEFRRRGQEARLGDDLRSSLRPVQNDGDDPAAWQRALDGERLSIDCASQEITFAPLRDENGAVIGAARVARHVGEREDQLRRLADAMPQLASITRRDGTPEYANARWSEFALNGDTPPGGGLWQGLLHPDDEPGVLASWRRSVEAGEPFSAEYRLLGRDGAYRWFIGRAFPVQSPAGAIDRWLVSSTDIHAQKMAPEAIKESEARYRELFDNMTEGLALCEVLRDASGTAVNYRYLEVNEGFTDQTGLSRDWMRGKVATDALPKLEPIWIKRFLQVVETGEPMRFVEYNADTDRYYDILCYRSSRDRFAFLVRDITLEQQREAALKESEGRLRRFFEAGLVGAIFWDIKGGILDANDKFLEIVGYSRDDLIAGRIDWVRMTPPEFKEGDEKAIAELNAKGSHGIVEKEYFRKDGSRVAIAVTSAFLDDSRSRGVGFVLDISHRKEIEAELRELTTRLEARVRERTLELEMANKELEAFSYSVSHDLRAPLRGIDGFSRIVQDRYADKLDDPGRDYLTRIRNGAARMGRLIDDLLQLSRVGRAEFRKSPVSVTELATQVVAELRQRDPERHVEVAIAQGLSAHADPGLLQIVLSNLIGNAWKFTGKLDSARVEVGCREGSDERVYFVGDNGAGFDPAYADKMFSPFQRLHNERDFAGTGIGLAIAHRIIARHGGRLWAEGRPDEGATFYFTLPA